MIRVERMKSLNKSPKSHLFHQHVTTLEIDDVNEKKTKKTMDNGFLNKQQRNEMHRVNVLMK